MSVEEFTLGQRVRFDFALTRVERSEPHGEFGRSEIWKRWVERGTPPEGGHAGVIVGTRTLSNGVNRYYGFGEPIEYRPREHFKVYLIAFDMRQNPVYVLPERIRAT